MLIKKYQSGGMIYTPRLSNTNVQQKQSVSNDNDGEQIEKAIIDVLNEQGLPSDVDFFLKQANTLLTSVGPSFGSNNYNMGDLIKLNSLANKIKFNNEMFNQASELIISENAGSEIALTNLGQMYVINQSGKLQTINPSEYYKHKDSYTPITNSYLMNERAYANNLPLAFNGTILQDMSNVIGMESIMEYVQSTINNFGTNKETQSTDRFTTKEKNQIERGFEQILSGVAPEGIYKVNSETSTSHQGYYDDESFKMALNYLYSSLPTNMKNVLKANTAAYGLDPSKSENVQKLLAQALFEHTSHDISNKLTVDYDQTASKNAGLGAVARSEQQVPQSYLEMVATGAVTMPVELSLRPSTGKSNLVFQAQPYPLLDKSGDQMGTMTIKKLVNNAQIGNIIDKNSITFGNSRITSDAMDMILYDDSSQLHRAWLPYDEETLRNNGIYRPDVDAIEKFDQFNKWLRSGKYSDIRIQQKINELGLNLVYDAETGEYKFKNQKCFLIVTGVTSHRAVDISDGWKGKVSSSEASSWYSKLENMSAYEEGFFEGWWGDADTIYKSAIFMPILDPAMATVATNHQYVPKTSYNNIVQNRQAQSVSDNLKTNW